MIKSTKIRRGRRKKFTQLGLHTSPSLGVDAKSPSYFEKEFLIVREKYVFPYMGLIFLYQGLFLQEIWDLETRKFMDKHPSRISYPYLFINNELAILEMMAK